MNVSNESNKADNASLICALSYEMTIHKKIWKIQTIHLYIYNKYCTVLSVVLEYFTFHQRIQDLKSVLVDVYIFNQKRK